MSVKHARSWQQARTTRRFFTTTCRDRVGELMAGDDDQRESERVSSRAVPEVAVPRPEAGEEMDVRRLKSHSGNAREWKVSTMTRSWSRALLNPSRLAQHAASLGLHEGRVVALTAARANVRILKFVQCLFCPQRNSHVSD